MLKIRLHGVPEEIQEMIQNFKKNYEVFSVSNFYKDKGDSKYGRVYLEMQLKQ